MAIDAFNDPLVMKWWTDSNGNKISVLRTNENQKVIKGCLYLNEIPDQTYKVNITGYFEIPFGRAISNSQEYVVNYTTGQITFNSTEEGKTITIGSYYSRGLICYPTSRIYNKLDAAGNVIETLADLLSFVKIEYKNPVSTFSNIITTYPTPELGWAVQCTDTGRFYRWDGTQWYYFQILVPTQIANVLTNMGILSSLITTVKSDLVSAINENTANIALKVDKVTGKGLSTNDYDNTEKAEVAKVVNKTDKTYVDTQLQSVASGSPKGIYANLAALQAAIPAGNTNIYLTTDNGNWNYWNGSAWTVGGIYQSTGIGNKTIAEEKLNFAPMIGLKSKNLFNKATVTSGVYVDYTSGGLPSNSSYSASDYIPVSPSTAYYKNSTQQWAYYDANKAYISGVVSGNSFTTPSNCQYMRISLLNTELNTLQLEAGTVGTSYKAYGNFIDPNTVTNQSLLPQMMSFYDNPILSNNLFNQATITSGYYVNYQTGALSALAGYNASDYIQVVAGDTYIKAFAEQFAFYDSNKAYISGLAGVTTFTVPANVCYVRFSIKNEQLSTFQVNKGNQFMSYDSFIQDYRINADKLYFVTDATKTVFIVDQAGHGHYKKINDAIIDIAAKGYTQKITLVVMPGTYEEIVNLHGNTHISIVGVSKKDCILIDKSGDYANCPLQISGEGYITNITIVANHDNNPTLTGVSVYAYAVHADYEGVGTTVFENCRFESYQNAAVGIGMHQSQTLKFRNCEFYKDGTIYDGGCLYFHNSITTGVTAQRLIIENCDIRSKQGTSINITDANIGYGGGGGNDMIVEFINTMAYSEVSGKNSLFIGNTPTVTNGICGSIVLDRKSYGNNIALFNV